MRQGVLNIFTRLGIGQKGEDEVLEAIRKLLQESSNNYFLIPKAKISNGTSTIEIDLTLLHATLGIFAIEVKNWKSLEYISPTNDPFEQVSLYKNILLGHIEDNLGKIPINVEYRVVFPNISKNEGDIFFQKNPKYKNYYNHTFFQEDLNDRALFKRFFHATKNLIPNKKEFLAIASLLVDKKSIEKKKEKILPVITQNEIMFFDYKQLSILNNYTSGFRIIRGVAGTGKTVILTNFIINRIKNDPDEKILVLCFNKQLKSIISSAFNESEQKNVAVLSLFDLLKRIDFDEEAVGIDEKDSFNEKFEKLKTKAATNEFQKKFRLRLEKKPIDLFLCDETQDMPPNLMRVIYEEIKDCIFFIDEAQKFYTYSMNSIAEVFHHPSFPKISMKGRVKNLKNVYRTPSNISKCAFEILSYDTKLNAYYRKSHYLDKSFLNDINFLLADGTIHIGEYEEFLDLKEFIAQKEYKDITILTHYKDTVQKWQRHFQKGGFNHIKVMTFQSIKGLESDLIILHNLDEFLKIVDQKESELLYRKLYVLLTRAKKEVVISLPKEYQSPSQKVEKVLHTLKKYASTHVENEDNVTTAKLIPTIKKYKEEAEMVVLAAELFSLVAGIFA
ncbi:NERD domain-containing protein [Nitratiruptor sp. SB155-2]|uniref:NERD domain-containing protein n=1 Tax=Nitratiruptor sp. (strain SB155-2) TaxID=387092 RepID=UPI0001586E53|nr:NERD domain-containing protein [Nitratiruptor sp. SB155-2]BAF69155.1 hypothetical protein NIS_0037 [Nitratiruptor sp. SB155-2]